MITGSGGGRLRGTEVFGAEVDDELRCCEVFELSEFFCTVDSCFAGAMRSEIGSDETGDVGGGVAVEVLGVSFGSDLIFG